MLIMPTNGLSIYIAVVKQDKVFKLRRNSSCYSNTQNVTVTSRNSEDAVAILGVASTMIAISFAVTLKQQLFFPAMYKYQLTGFDLERLIKLL